MSEATETREAVETTPRRKRGGLTMPTNPGKDLQDLMLRQMEKEPGAPTEEVKNITGNTESNITAHINDSVSEHKESKEDAHESENMPAQMTAQMPELLQAQLLGNMESRADADVKQRRSAGNSGSAASREGAPLPLSQRGVRLAAQEKVRQLGGTSQIPITLRLAEGLNDEVDEIAHRHRKAKVKKQDLITLAVQLLITELDSGADLSDLLDTYARSGR